MTKIKLLVTNDLHSRHVPFDSSVGENVGGSARRSTFFQREAEVPAGEAADTDTHVLVLDVGDAFLGSNYFSFFNGEVEMKMLQKLGYRAFAVGNHDFDQGGLPNLLKQARAHAPEVTLLCATLVYASSKETVFKRYEIFELGDVKVAVVGLLGENAWKVIPDEYKEDLELLDVMEVAVAVVDEIQRLHQPELMVCLSHTGIRAGDTVLAGEGLFDIIFSGHEHYQETMEWMKVDNARQNGLGGTWLHPGNWGGTAVSKVLVEIGSDRRIQSCTPSTEMIGPEIDEDSEITKVLEAYDETMLPVISEVIGKCVSESFTFAIHKGDIHSSLGRFVCEGLKNAFADPAQVGVVNNGAIRNGLRMTRTTWGDINEVWPFIDKLFKVQVSGSVIHAFAEMNVTRIKSGRLGMAYHLAGLEVDYFNSDKPSLARHDIQIGGEPVEANKLYTVAITSYCFNNDWVKNIDGMREAAVEIDVVDNIRDALVSYVRSIKVIK